MPKSKHKIFVLDTNVILHDSTCIYQFQEHDIVIPIAVLEELDNFKKGNESIHFHAREFVRTVDALSGDKLFNDGVRIGDNLGKLSIRFEKEFHPVLESSFPKHGPDHIILNIAYKLAEANPKTQVILVTKDVNLRMKAKSVGLMAQDYKTDHVRDISTLYAGHRTIDYVSPEIIDQLYQEPFEIDVDQVSPEHGLTPNEFLIIRHEKKSVLGYYDGFSKLIRRIGKTTAYGIASRNAEQAFALSALMNDDIRLITITGKAGTGKTLLSLAASLESRKNYLQIFVARPVVPLSNKDIGYLPGNINAKLIPYMQPLYDNLSVIQNQFRESDRNYKKINQLLDEEKLKIEPLAYIRGRSLVRIYFIVDEAQNLTPHEIKTIITRAGEGTKIVFTGDVFQIDHPYLDTQSNGLSHLIEKMKGQKLYAHINLEKGERSELADLASTLL